MSRHRPDPYDPWIPTPPEIARQPELAPLALLRDCALVARWSLIAIHPALAGDPAYYPGDPVFQAARALCLRALNLGHYVEEYLAAVDAEDPSHDDF